MKLRSVLALAGISLGLAGCSDSDDPAAPALTSVRVVHAVPDAPLVDIDLDGATVIEDLDYAKNSGTLTPSAATYDVAVQALLPDGTRAAVIEADDLALDSGTRYTIVAVGTVADGDAFPLEPVVIADTGSLADATQVRVRVAHLASNAPAVDIYITAPSAEIASATPTLSGVSYKGVSGALEVPAGDYRIRIMPAGSADVVYDSGTVALTAGADLLVGALTNDGTGSSPVKLVVADATTASSIYDASAGADLRVVHASPDVGPVDVLLNDELTGITDFALGEVALSATDYVTSLPAGAYNVKVNQTGTDVTGIDTDVTFDNGRSYTAIAVGKFNEGVGSTLDLLALADQRRAIATQASVRLVHAATLANEVDIYLLGVAAPVSGNPAFSDVPFKANTDFFAVAEGTYDVVVTPAGTTDEALRATISVSNGGLYSAIVRDNNAGDAVTVLLTDDFVE